MSFKPKQLTKEIEQPTRKSAAIWTQIPVKASLLAWLLVAGFGVYFRQRQLVPICPTLEIPKELAIRWPGGNINHLKTFLLKFAGLLFCSYPKPGRPVHG